MIVALRVELAKIFSKWRTFIGFIVLAIVVPIVIVSMGAEGMQYFSFATQGLQRVFTITGNLMNGYSASYLLIGMLYVHIPFLVTLVAGDTLAGEATAGTYRLILTRPISRFTMVTSKYIATLLSTTALVAFLAVLSLGLGIAMLGTGEVVVLKSKITILASNDALWRFALAYGYGALAMCTVSSIAFFLSAIVENAIGPIMTTMGIIIGLLILSSISSSWMDSVRPWFFTSHINAWRYFFDQAPEWGTIVHSTLVLFGYCIACYVGAVFVMYRKDILT